ncbi:ArsR family transcriptional regulator [Isoptericola jiangsuensis]|uniref:ArsR family transcriptional regulator n=1 Tax=Isoptericola jiangsuensis TaxID=548579 RepID=A0A2A9EY33_9MICO|nr:helix-turn-helix transcriptional regulator [Isoptericola jiangsuensis]PFG43222.1 ArsR family transcriptional regulator [Isoptericola jiangsuensis]
MSTTVDDELWSALGDPTRRRMLDVLVGQGASTATSLAGVLPVTRQAVAKHLLVLERAGLVHAVTVGRQKQFRLDEAQLRRAMAQLADVGAAWDARLSRVRRIAEAIQQDLDGSQEQDRSPAPGPQESTDEPQEG